MIKTKSLISIFTCLSVVTSCSSINNMQNSFSSSISSAKESMSKMIDSTLDKKVSNNQIIEKSLYNKADNMGGALQMRGVNEFYTIKINHVAVNFENESMGPMTTTFSGVVFIDAVDEQIETPITFVTNSLLGTRKNYISGHKFTLESISLDRFHMAMKYNYEQSFEKSLKNVLATQLNGVKLINLYNTSAENRAYFESNNFKQNKHKPKIKYSN